MPQRFARLAKRCGIKATLKDLRTYSASELLAAGTCLRTVAGRLGHGSGGVTTLKVYAAWLSEADQKAAPVLRARMPEPPAEALASQTVDGTIAAAERRRRRPPDAPYMQIAEDLRGAIRLGVLPAGSPLPPVKVVAERYGVTASTAHRAIAQLKTEGLVRTSRGSRTIVTGGEEG